jgi:hypothetical protein
MADNREMTWPCKCGGVMRLKHYEETLLKDAAKYFFRCRCGQRLLLKEIWLK